MCSVINNNEPFGLGPFATVRRFTPQLMTAPRPYYALKLIIKNYTSLMCIKYIPHKVPLRDLYHHI